MHSSQLSYVYGIYSWLGIFAPVVLVLFGYAGHIANECLAGSSDKEEWELSQEENHRLRSLRDLIVVCSLPYLFLFPDPFVCLYIYDSYI